MRQKELSLWLIVVFSLAIAACAAAAVFVMPVLGQQIAEWLPDKADFYVPCLIFFYVALIPVLWSLVLAIRVACEIGRDNSFCMDNSLRLRTVSRLAAADTILCITGGVTLSLCGGMTGGGALVFIAVCVVGIAVAVTMAALSHLIAKAAVLKTDSDLTI